MPGEEMMRAANRCNNHASACSHTCLHQIHLTRVASCSRPCVLVAPLTPSPYACSRCSRWSRRATARAENGLGVLYRARVVLMGPAPDVHELTGP